jgi:hypothetical protein
MLFRLVRDPGTPLRVPLLCAARSECSDRQMKLSPTENAKRAKRRRKIRE